MSRTLIFSLICQVTSAQIFWQKCKICTLIYEQKYQLFFFLLCVLVYRHKRIQVGLPWRDIEKTCKVHVAAKPRKYFQLKKGQNKLFNLIARTVDSFEPSLWFPLHSRDLVSQPTAPLWNGVCKYTRPGLTLPCQATVRGKVSTFSRSLKKWSKIRTHF